MKLLQIFLGLIFSLILLARSAPLSEDGLELFNVTLPHLPYNTTNASTVSTQGYDPSFTWHDYSTAQIWMGKSKVAVGSMVGHELYKTVCIAGSRQYYCGIRLPSTAD
ncbi:hypothetical protein BDU57DRAFT_543784 [Ampelomyces quisqualis]|uniref:Uncharacterized protein n=1 Tax=Ampelomyces quisqualis TaxID=50730 RepID=A0A6A5Q4B3_AMPQU|nr:hypothetical protein BDU57DRAFT_543784 [Ampelomyces quisqualis]